MLDYRPVSRPVPLKGGGFLVGWSYERKQPIISLDGYERTLERLQVAWIESGEDGLRYGDDDLKRIHETLLSQFGPEIASQFDVVGDGDDPNADTP
jgi:hypothetical protein